MRDATSDPRRNRGVAPEDTSSGIDSTLCHHCRWIGGEHDVSCRASAAVTGLEPDRRQIVYRKPGWMDPDVWGRLVVLLSAEWDRLVEEYVR